MTQIKEQTKNVLKAANIQNYDRKSGSDTIRIWEGYKAQAVLWRALSIIQLLATTAISILCIILWQTRSITLSVPQRPVPGQYNTQEIPDADFIELANSFVSLIAHFNHTLQKINLKELLLLLTFHFFLGLQKTI